MDMNSSPSETDKVVVYHGDCLDVLRTLADNSVDSIVTDPPYSLTDGRQKNCASDMLRHTIVMDAQHTDAERNKNLVTLDVTLYCFDAVGIGGVDLDRKIVVRQEEVNNDSPTVRRGDDVLVDVGDAVSGEQSGRGQFRLWVREGTSRCIGACRCLRQDGDGRIRISVRLRDDPTSQTKTSPGVMTFRGAELVAVLALDLTRRTAELLPACGADALDPSFELLCPQEVGAVSTARRLTSPTETSDFSKIHLVADGARTFDLLAHNAVLSWSPTMLRGFMSKEWDGTGIETDVRLWAECRRVLKPGGHLLSFGGTRTYHRLTCAIEDAGFEIRDSIAWLYGSGFPKSLDVSKAIDNAGGSSPEEQSRILCAARLRSGFSRDEVAERVGCTPSSVRDWEEGRARATGRAVEFITPSPQYREVLADLLGYTADERRVSGVRLDRRGDGTVIGLGHSGVEYGAPATPDALKWQGWGTALKPAFEPIVVARKPLIGTVATNVLTHGTGALNIDGTRVEYQDAADRSSATPQGRVTSKVISAIGATPDAGRDLERVEFDRPEQKGRWPANVLLDDSQAEALDAQTGMRKSSGIYEGDGLATSTGAGATSFEQASDTGGASRFFPTFGREGEASADRRYTDEGATNFAAKPGQRREAVPKSEMFPTFKYQAKAPTKERPKVDGVAHPTVKPLALMQWLVRLVTPHGGVVLDPFAGSGSTGEAAVLEGFDCILAEKSAEYLPLIKVRLDRVNTQMDLRVVEPEVVEVVVEDVVVEQCVTEVVVEPLAPGTLLAFAPRSQVVEHRESRPDLLAL